MSYDLPELEAEILSDDSLEKLWMVVHVLFSNTKRKYNQDSWGKCTSGIITKDKWFNDKGLTRRNNYTQNEPLYKDYSDFDALRIFFGLSADTNIKIFSGFLYIHSVTVAAERLEKWLLKCEKLKSIKK